MLSTIIILIVSAVVIYLSCELFVNGVEWVGARLNISKNAVGTILAAFGTALPESVVTFVAVVFGVNAAQKDIGVGAALGGPLVLSTIAYAVVGIAIFLFRKRRNMGTEVSLSGSNLARDQMWFLSIFVFKFALGFVAFQGKALTGFIFLFAYAFYVYTEMKPGGEAEHEDLEPLTFRRHDARPATTWIILQTVVSLAIIGVASQVFVKQLDHLSLSLGIAPHIIALFLSPIATELPETLNAIIWVRQGKDRLALANISGAMMIQATVPSALGIFFTPWRFDTYLGMAGIITIVSILFLWNTLRNHKLSATRLTLAASFYVLFALAVQVVR